MRIAETGDPSRPPLVLVHGLASSSRCWARTLPAVERRHRVLLVDLFAAAERRFSLERSADELAERLRDLRVECAALVGHSMGGLIALHLAAQAPHAVSSLVLVDVPAVPHERRRLGQVLAVARSSTRREASAMGLILSCVLRTSPVTLLAATRATIGADLELQARSARIPSLLVWGARDAIVPLAVGERLASHMRASELVVIPDAGHQPMWESPVAFNAVLQAFLARDSWVSAGAAAVRRSPDLLPAG